MKPLLILLALAFSFAQGEEADQATFYLKSGSIRKGELVSFEAGVLQVKTTIKGKSKIMTMPKEKFRKVILADGSSLDLTQVGLNEKPLLAVLDFVAEEVSESNARTITQKFQTELTRTGAFTMLDRAQMDLILQEQGFQASGVCAGECQVEMGQLLGAEKLVSGLVSKVGEYHTIVVNLIDVATGSIEHAESQDIKGGIGEVLTQLAPALAIALAGVSEPTEQKAELSEKSGASSTAWWVTGGLLLVAGAGTAAYFLSSVDESGSEVNEIDIENTIQLE